MKIDVKYTEEDIGAGRTVEKLQIRLGDRNPDGSVHSDEVMLVDGIYSTQFGINQLPTLNPAFDPNQPNGPGNEQYLDKEGNPTEVEANAKMYDDPRLALYVKGLRDKEGMPDPDAVEALKTQKPDAMYPYPPYDQVLVLDDNDLYGALQSQREFLTYPGQRHEDHQHPAGRGGEVRCGAGWSADVCLQRGPERRGHEPDAVF